MKFRLRFLNFVSVAYIYIYILLLYCTTLLPVVQAFASMTHPIHCVIFDLDGTLLDTETLSTESIISVLDTIGVTGLTWDLKKKLLGLRGPEWTKIVIDELQINDKITSEDMVKGWEENMSNLCPTIEKMPGAELLTAELTKRGIRMAIATSSSSAQVEKKKSKHQGLFERMELVVCGDDSEVLHGKPAPDMYLVTARRLGLDPCHCLVFEDAISGVQSGAAAGMHVVAIPDPRLLEDPPLKLIFTETASMISDSLEDFARSEVLHFGSWSFIVGGGKEKEAGII